MNWKWILSTHVCTADGMGLSLVHFSQQAIASWLWDLRYSQAGHTELYPAGNKGCVAITVDLCFWNFPSLTPFYYCSHRKKEGERIGESRLSAVADCSSSLVWFPFPWHTHTHTQGWSATYMLTHYSRKDCQVHWGSYNNWLAAEDWGAVAWQAALVQVQAMNCWQRALMVSYDHDLHLAFG